MEQNNLEKKVGELNKLLARQIRLQSFWWSLLRGIATSIGWVLGIAVLLTLSAYLVERFSGIPVLGKILEYVRFAAGRGR